MHSRSLAGNGREKRRDQPIGEQLFMEADGGQPDDFVRRYWYGDSVSEIALRYEISQSAVLMRLSRMREKLAVYLKKEGFQV